MGIEEEKNPAHHRNPTQNPSVLRCVLYSCPSMHFIKGKIQRQCFDFPLITPRFGSQCSQNLSGMKKGLEKNTQKYSIVEYSIKIYPSFERCNGTHPLIFTILVNPHIGPVIGCSKNKINPARLEKEFKTHVNKCCKKAIACIQFGRHQG